MKSWLRKFKISAALDGGRPLPNRLRRTIANTEELRRFEQSALNLETALKTSRPVVEAPPFIHDCIMQAVEAAIPGAPVPRKIPLVRWLPAPGLAILLLVGWWFLHHLIPGPSPAIAASQSLAVVATALEAGNEMTRSLPVAVVTPLSEELDRVSLDLDHTTQFLLANVP